MPDFTASCILTDPRELLGVVPFLLGYHPGGDVVVLLVDSGTRVRHAARMRLEDADDEDNVRDIIAVAAKEPVTAAFVVGYGPDSARDQITSVAGSLHAAIPVVGRFLVADGWCRCVTAGCACRASRGLAFAPDTTVAAAIAVAEGVVALPSRQDLLALVLADSAAQQAISTITRTLSVDIDAALLILQSVLKQAEAGQRLTDRQAAELAQALTYEPVMATAWQKADKQPWQADLWLDMTRRLPDSHVAPVANLAAWCAWRRGSEELAFAAWERAVLAGPATGMSTLIGALLVHRLPASQVAWPRPADALAALRRRLSL
jgi:hypothetical protein